MGIDAAAMQFLYAAKASGVDFSEAATLGRQELLADSATMTPIIEAFRGRGSAAELLAECGEVGDRFLRTLGAKQVVSFDASDYEGASVLHDMNRPVPVEHHRRFSVVFDGGTIEHVFDATQAYRNCLEMVRPGGHYLVVTTGNNFLGHGFYQFSPEFFFRTLTEANGYRMGSVLLCEPYESPPRFFRVQDPASVGGRVELLNARPVYVFAIAQRVEATPLFAQTPQQSDYAAAWEQKRAPIPSKRGRRPLLKRLESSFRKRVGRPLKRALRLRGKSVDGFRKPYYRPLTLDEMTRGVLP